MKFIAWIIKGTLTVLVLVALLLIVRGFSDARIDYNVSTEGVSIPQYTAIDIPFDQSNDFSSAHPFAAGAIIDIDNDGIRRVVPRWRTGATGRAAALYGWRLRNYRECCRYQQSERGRKLWRLGHRHGW